MISPCISLCTVDNTGVCLGCARTIQEKRFWKDPETTNQWKEENLEECRDRMSGEQLDYWQKSYEFKLAHGRSMYKYGKEIKNET